MLNMQLQLVATDGQGGISSTKHLTVYVLQVVIPVFPQYTDKAQVLAIYRNRYLLSHSQILSTMDFYHHVMQCKCRFISLSHSNSH